MSKHTTGPWETDGIAIRSSGPDGRQIALTEISVRGRPYEETYNEAVANAAFIVRACNAHDDLLAALRAIVSSLSAQDDEGLIEHAQPMQDARAAIATAAG